MGVKTFSLLFKKESSMIESNFQKRLIKEIKERYPGCVVLKNDASYAQGIPDLVIFYGPYYAFLECKKNAKATHRPNQDRWIDLFSKWSFARFVYPENTKEVLSDLDQSFKRFSEG